METPDTTQQDNTEKVVQDQNTPPVEAPKADEVKPAEVQQEAKAEQNDDGLLANKPKVEDAPKAPEAYEAFVVNGEALDEASQKEAAEVAKSLNMTQAEAQRAIDYTDRVLSKMIEENSKAVEEERTANAKEWAEKDKDGTLTLLAEKGLEHLGMRDYIKTKGWQYDAKMLSAFAEVGRFVSEGKSISGKPVTRQPRLYENSPSLYE